MHWFWISLSIGLIVLDLASSRLFFSFVSSASLLTALSTKLFSGSGFGILWQAVFFVLTSALLLVVGILIKNKILKTLKSKTLTKKK